MKINSLPRFSSIAWASEDTRLEQLKTNTEDGGVGPQLIGRRRRDAYPWKAAG